MNVAAKQHPVEILVEWAAPLCLAVAMGWAGGALGLSAIQAGGLAIACFLAGSGLLRWVGKPAAAAFDFQPAAVEPQAAELEELLLEWKDELLELTDPLIDAAPDSRVVRLFDRQEPTPGELVERITEYLGEGRRPVEAAPAAVGPSSPIDASAALHAALANIRASLR